ncbi:MAG TPA: hypothetical protein QF683_10760 [SAR324 cluster bacterium]|jgi:hypothetical protein|nr:hypothetical protein [SAR324 cluster bacterium]|tara:strand:- start:736 stop:1476 length:741 start_codon:yes stop_codon:yes gene_type:complete
MFDNKKSGNIIYYKRIVVIILLFAQLFFVNILKGESKFREEKNIQLQILIGGGLIGYHFNDQIFIGFSTISNMVQEDGTMDNSSKVESRLIAEEDLPQGLYGKKYEQRRIVTGQLRISPFESSGFFLSFGSYQEGPRKETLYFDKRSRIIGNSSYNNTSMIIKIERDPVYAPLIGFGWNWIYDNGLSWGFDWEGGLINGNVTKATAEITTNNSNVSVGDIAIEEEKFIKSSDLSTGYFTVALGYNF